MEKINIEKINEVNNINESAFVKKRKEQFDYENKAFES
jgi:hypothetical protein